MKNIIVFSSQGPGNFQNVLDFCSLNQAEFRVIALFVDSMGIPSVAVANSLNIPVHFFEFAANLNTSSPSSKSDRTLICNNILKELIKIELQVGIIDLIVLSFRRILVGEILNYFKGRIINVHPADLSIYDVVSKQPKYVSIAGLRRSLLDGLRLTRTTIHFVDEGIDTGQIICLGPSVTFTEKEVNAHSILKHEKLQKVLSDRPALHAALKELLYVGEQNPMIVM